MTVDTATDPLLRAWSIVYNKHYLWNMLHCYCNITCNALLKSRKSSSNWNAKHCLSEKKPRSKNCFNNKLIDCKYEFLHIFHSQFNRSPQKDKLHQCTINSNLRRLTLMVLNSRKSHTFTFTQYVTVFGTENLYRCKEDYPHVIPTFF